VFDWGRKDRQLHLEQALQCIHFGPCDAARFEPRSEAFEGGVRRTELVHCDEFHLTRVQIEREHSGPLPSRGARVWMVLDGQGTLGGPDFESVELRRGQTLLLPAGLAAASLRASAGSTWLEVTFPRSDG
jgi:mannose-6-phosphate isomerase class I